MLPEFPAKAKPELTKTGPVSTEASLEETVIIPVELLELPE
jgi:hypothetical protein